jgi:hypothetical protein
MPEPLIAPQPLDLVFSGGKGEWQSVLSVALQPLSDETAKNAQRSFSHVSIVIDDRFALEAVPLDDYGAVGEFSGATLRGGVRIIPVLDLVVPLWQRGSSFIVLRHRNASHAASAFRLDSRSVLELLGSEYSLNGLRDAAETKLRVLPQRALDWLRQSFNWSSPPSNLGAALIDDQTRRSLERTIPGYTFPFKNCSYFCSKLAAEVVSTGGLAAFTDSLDRITPTGLYVRLAGSPDWSDATDSAYSDAGLRESAASSPASCRAAYESVVEGVDLALQSMGLGSVVDLMTAGTDKVHADLQRASELMKQLGWDDPQRKWARNNEAAFVEALVEQAGIVEPSRQQRFREAAQVAVRGFTWGALDYDGLVNFLARIVADDDAKRG